jgi:hypothetical protein
MSSQQLTFGKQAVSDLNSFLEEISEINRSMLENINQTECAVLAEFDTVK